MNVEQDLNEIINEIKGGNKDYARELLRNFIKDNPTNEKGWWIYAKISPNIDQRIFCLGKVLEINPNNVKAKEQLRLDKENRKKHLSSSFESDSKERSSKRGKSRLLITAGILVIIAIVFASYIVFTTYTQPQKFTAETDAKNTLISEQIENEPSPTLLLAASMEISLTPEPSSSWTPNPTDFPTPAEPTPTPTPLGGGSGFIAFEASIYPQVAADIFTLDLSNMSLLQLMFSRNNDHNPKWSPDGN